MCMRCGAALRLDTRHRRLHCGGRVMRFGLRRRGNSIEDSAASAVHERFAFTIAGVAVSVVFAWCSWHLYEQRVLRLKRYFPYQRRAPAEPPTGADAVPTRTAQ